MFRIDRNEGIDGAAGWEDTDGHGWRDGGGEREEWRDREESECWGDGGVEWSFGITSGFFNEDNEGWTWVCDSCKDIMELRSWVSFCVRFDLGVEVGVEMCDERDDSDFFELKREDSSEFCSLFETDIKWKMKTMWFIW